MLDTKNTSRRKIGSGSTIIATNAIIPAGKIPDFIIAKKLLGNTDLSFVNSMTLNPPCQKPVTQSH